jgi:hypothetical protein
METRIDAGAGAPALPETLDTWARRGVWLLPVWALLLALSTLTSQPDYGTDFPAYAEYVTTTTFLVSHVFASIGGAALGALGAVALGVLLATTVAARQALWGMALFVASQVLLPSVFGVAAFFQPAVGRAWLDGARAVAEVVNEDVYEAPPLFAMVGVALLLFVAGAILLGRAAVRAGLGPTWAGVLFAVGVPLFGIGGQLLSFLHPIAGLLLMASGIALALAARRP